MSDPILAYAGAAANISLRDLQTIVSVAKTGSFRTSARLLHTSQPAISRTVKRVESYFDTAIFRRGPRGAELTPAGAEIVQSLSDVLAELGRLRYTVRTERAATIRIGAAPTAASVFLAPQIERWIASHPQDHLEVLEEGADTLREMLLSERCDIALIAGPLGDRITGLFLQNIPIQALFRPDTARGQSTQPISLDELAHENLLLYVDNFITTSVLREAFNQVALQPRIAYQSANAGALLRLAESGLGVAVVGKTVDISRTSLVPRPVVSPAGEPLSFDLHAAWLTKNTDVAVHAFAQGIQQHSQTVTI